MEKHPILTSKLLAMEKSTITSATTRISVKFFQRLIRVTARRREKEEGGKKKKSTSTFV